jgi:hypothetical protein
MLPNEFESFHNFITRLQEVKKEYISATGYQYTWGSSISKDMNLRVHTVPEVLTALKEEVE